MRHLIQLAAALLLIASSSAAKNIEFHFIYVGQGDCTLVKTPNGRNILVDCGSTGEGDADQAKAYIDEQIGVDGYIDVLVVTHPDADHYNYIEHVVEGHEVGRVLYVGTYAEHSDEDFYLWLKAHPNRKKLTKNHHDQPDEPSVLFGTGDATFHILAANVGSKKNDRSIVVMVSYGQFDVLLTGDATWPTEREILKRYKDDLKFLDVELLKLGHHGSTSSTHPKWLSAVQPETAIASAGFNSTHEHPRKVVVKRTEQFTGKAAAHPFRWGVGSGHDAVLEDVEGYQEDIYSTATNGNIVVTSNGSTYAVSVGGDEKDGGVPPLPSYAAPKEAGLSPSEVDELVEEGGKEEDVPGAAFPWVTFVLAVGIPLLVLFFAGVGVAIYRADRHVPQDHSKTGLTARDFEESYLAITRGLRIWLLAYGVGVPVLLASQNAFQELLREANAAGPILVIFLLGVSIQIVTVLVYKAAMWWTWWGLTNEGFQDTRRYKFSDWLDQQLWLELLIDATSIVLFAWATVWVLLEYFKV